MVKRKTKGGGVRRCSSGWGSTSSGSACTIGTTYPTDSGVYWCESADGEQSNGVNITITGSTLTLTYSCFNMPIVTSESMSEYDYWMKAQHKPKLVSFFSKDRTVILESPALPVSAGATVTLRCQGEMNSSDHVFNFYKDDHHISSSSTGELTFPSISKSDEGLYTCSISGGVESASSWLAVHGERNKLKTKAANR